VPDQAYIVAMGKFLPNAPVDNERIEQVLGTIDGRPSRAKRITLRNNGIKTRHYAIDPATGLATHNNAQLTALAVRSALKRLDLRMRDVDLLACGTSAPDQLKPAHANMVHAELGEASMEVLSTAGVCSAGLAAMKYAWFSVKSGSVRRAVSTGSELASSFMVGRNFEAESEQSEADIERAPQLAFEKDFLRWMLSDGAGAAVIADKPVGTEMALRIDWIDGISLAHELPVCMYSGAVKLPDGQLRGWREAPTPSSVIEDQYFAVKQDARLLDELIPRLISAETIGAMAKKHGLAATDVDWLVPHYSSEYFRPVLARCLDGIPFHIPYDRWFTNLTTVGNVGSASMYLMLEDLLYSGKLKRGQRILCFVPESARFFVYYMLLTVV
jgi:3-oxoacyl-[acyl-carrier-protein] synthase III